MRVSLNEGLTVLDFKDSNTVTIQALRQVIRNNGFVAKDAELVARGRVIMTGGQIEFEISGSQERFVLAPSPNNPGPMADVVLTGRADHSDPKRVRFEVQSVRKP